MTGLLDENTIYIVLFLRSDPPQPNDFHWAIYYHRSNNRATKYHIVNEGPNHSWIAGHGPEFATGILKAFLLVGLIRIAGVATIGADDSNGAAAAAAVDGSATPKSLNEKVEHILRANDHKLNDIQGITCRVWLLERLRVLYEEGLLFDMRCAGDIKKLENVVKQWGNQFQLEAAKNVQPRPVQDKALAFE